MDHHGVASPSLGPLPRRRGGPLERRRRRRQRRGGHGDHLGPDGDHGDHEASMMMAMAQSSEDEGTDSEDGETGSDSRARGRALQEVETEKTHAERPADAMTAMTAMKSMMGDMSALELPQSATEAGDSRKVAEHLPKNLSRTTSASRRVNIAPETRLAAPEGYGARRTGENLIDDGSTSLLEPNSSRQNNWKTCSTENIRERQAQYDRQNSSYSMKSLNQEKDDKVDNNYLGINQNIQRMSSSSTSSNNISTGINSQTYAKTSPVWSEATSPSKARLMVRGASSFNVFGASLGELTVGTNAADSQMRSVFGIDHIQSEAAMLQGENEQRVVFALLDAMDVLDARWASASLADVRYVCEELLPICSTLENPPPCVVHLEAYVSARIVLELVNFVVEGLLKQLEALADHLAFWYDLEDSPLRLQVVLMWQQPKTWRGLTKTIQFLDDLSVVQLGQLGRLKELALQFEDVRSRAGVDRLIDACIGEITSTLALPSMHTATATSSSTTSFATTSSNVIGTTFHTGPGAVARFWPEFSKAFASLQDVFRRQIEGAEQAPRHVKYWPEALGLAILAFGAGAYCIVRWDQTVENARRVADSMREFFVEHVVKPTATLVDELLFDRMLQVADAEAMNDAKQSLGRMLEDYVRDTSPNLIEAERIRIIRDLDVSILSRRYETELKKPFASLVSGDLVRMLLIQMQHLKKELLGIMATLDELMRENQFNLQVLALLPSLILAASVQQVGVQVLRALRGTKQSRRFIYASVRERLRDVEQTLNLHLEDHCTLRDAALGRLVLQVHLLENLLFSNQSVFDRHERKRLAEDVSELLSDQLSIAQKINTIHRMHRSYEFLAASALSTVSPFSLQAKLARFLL